jgi:hypothetical protein
MFWEMYMANVYHTHFLRLSGAESKGQPMISLFVPLRFMDFPQAKIFSHLLKAANLLLSREGHPKLELEHPDWGQWIRQGAVTLAIYKDAATTTIIPLPIIMPPRVVVADSFHVKPLLASSICVQEALLLHFSEVGASLYRISSGEEKLIDSYLPSKTKLKGVWISELARGEIFEFLEFLKIEVKSYRLNTTQFLSISGTKDSLLTSNEFWKDVGVPIIHTLDSPKNLHPVSSIALTRIKLSHEINGTYDRQVQLILNDSMNSTPALSELGKKIINREISKLCVSLEDVHFGKLDPATGNAIEMETQTSTKDDDLLDDLIELALKQKVQVSVVPKKYLPLGRTYLAS